MLTEDRVITCRDCGSEFAFTAGEQEFYRRKGFENIPARCKSCRDLRKRTSLGASLSSALSESAPGAPERIRHTVICSSCGTQTQVPFRPAFGKPVYCRECYHIRANRGEAHERPLML